MRCGSEACALFTPTTGAAESTVLNILPAAARGRYFNAGLIHTIMAENNLSSRSDDTVTQKQFNISVSSRTDPAGNPISGRASGHDNVGTTGRNNTSAGREMIMDVRDLVGQEGTATGQCEERETIEACRESLYVCRTKNRDGNIWRDKPAGLAPVPGYYVRHAAWARRMAESTWC
ncbi:hypothetical protein Bbelb_256800 [Branchiostoma belcheri]|nr:hypothetical protein Bbelb_256800 [Branchiostoma belcheri]